MEIRDHDDVEEGEEEQRKRKREIRDHDDVEESEEGKKKKRTGTTPMWRRARKKTLTLP